MSSNPTQTTSSISSSPYSLNHDASTPQIKRKRNRTFFTSSSPKTATNASQSHSSSSCKSVRAFGKKKWCYCTLCHGKAVSKSTYYRHNPEAEENDDSAEKTQIHLFDNQEEDADAIAARRNLSLHFNDPGMDVADKIAEVMTEEAHIMLNLLDDSVLLHSDSQNIDNYGMNEEWKDGKDLYDDEKQSIGSQQHELLEEENQRSSVKRGRPCNPPLPLDNCLYDGTSLVLRDALALLFSFQAKHKLTQAAMEDLHEMLKNKILPSVNLLPIYRHARETKLIDNNETVFDICVKDCIAFNGQYESAEVCPVCKEARYQEAKPKKICVETGRKLCERCNKSYSMTDDCLICIECGATLYQRRVARKVISCFGV